MITNLFLHPLAPVQDTKKGNNIKESQSRTMTLFTKLKIRYDN